MKIFAETERFLLRELSIADADGLYELDSDPEVHRYLGNHPVTDIQHILDVIQFVRQQYTDYGIGRWAVVDKRNQEFIGWAGLKFVTEPTNGMQHYYDLGYRLIRRYWGQGIATETAMASLQHAFSQLRTEEVFAAAHCENAASNKVLQKVGFQLVNTFQDHENLTNWYRITKPAFLLQTKKV